MTIEFTAIICEVCGLGNVHGVESTHTDNCSYYAGLPSKISDLQLALSSMDNKHRLLKECFRQDIERQAKERTARRIEREKLEDQVSDLKRALENIAGHATWALGTLVEHGIDTSLEEVHRKRWDEEAEYEASNT